MTKSFGHRIDAVFNFFILSIEIMDPAVAVYVQGVATKCYIKFVQKQSKSFPVHSFLGHAERTIPMITEAEKPWRQCACE